jgi:queuine tRNA-ribosyltransferase
LFAIIQGGLERDLREKCARELVAIGFDGYAIGGLAVGETEEEMYQMLDVVCPLLPPEKPRYLMGVGRIEQMKTAMAKGIDMFDCVLPMREARHGTLWLSNGSKIRIINSEFRHDHSVIDVDSPSPLGRTHKKSYLHHLLRAHERLGETIACSQNMGVTLKFFKNLQQAMTKS